MRKKDYLIESFISMVAERGMASSGVDAIAKYANVSKKTIYNQFGSKEALAIEAITKFSETIQSKWLTERKEIKDPTELLLKFFTELEESIENDMFYGCIFINMCREYPDLDHDLHKISQVHKNAARAELKTRLKIYGCDSLDNLLKIEILYEGLISQLLVSQDPNLVSKVKEFVLEAANKG
ncbi:MULTISPECIES: TetR/AcrR family transcriptional regulator [Pseudoalteromonas]|uniref:HTH tetR-type domain-containing protein n=1 Tax=Pseudoalteromonas arctica A 37-1-2 TaxID=1117313 RepID=A0A290S353_9GAMM|nr:MULTISPECIES: TetR family transcriptional regulator [Pseudoalteromonas]ATC86536.1 hypothetical protein PARC_a1991 [Pseudoalteromonas arctica A 37-1-2]MBH0004105.1 TetR family transcriptional regulator [Pseudoalteromonas sp. SWYJZ12]